ncbi:hypothetical protein P4U03_20490 [Bacillus mycoides]|uniref:hypothetical protein n=1 Tax=Bacillus cereus group TaxID=86661 RepID=UPI00032DE2B1|nr:MULTISPECIES: hypothetical protein [Bacillus cereus group]EOO04813.1 hypothetical protein IAW_05926 [Bacillus cereus str. Schrouff]EOO80830.1 hypothetical protein IGY_06111 [Bacillus cereus K-5975c]MED1268917.1 hypothetical protein [Bacillus mycoides]
MSEKNEFESHEILNGAAFDPNLIGFHTPTYSISNIANGKHGFKMKVFDSYWPS